MFRIHWLAAAGLALTMLPIHFATSQDTTAMAWNADSQVRFWIEPLTADDENWFPLAIQEHRGKVKEFDDQHFVAQLAAEDGEFAASSKRVLWIEPVDAPEKEVAALNLFHAAEFKSSLRPLVDAISARPPVWRQQWLSAVASQAAMRSGRYAIALELVSQLDQRPLPPLVIAWLPIVWQTQANDATMQAPASERLADPSPATRLVAASWLLSSTWRGQATTVLEQLAADDKRPYLAAQARALLWQVVPPPEVESRMSAWIDDLESLPMVLQTGPTLALVGKLNRSGKQDVARTLSLSLQLTPIHPHPDARP